MPKLVSHLDWHALIVPDVAAQLYHTLHGSHCLLYGAVYKVSPGNTTHEGREGDYETNLIIQDTYIIRNMIFFMIELIITSPTYTFHSK